MIYTVADLWNKIKQEALKPTKVAKEPPAGTKPTTTVTVYTIFFCVFIFKLSLV